MNVSPKVISSCWKRTGIPRFADLEVTVKFNNCEFHNCGVFGQNQNLQKIHNFGEFAPKIEFSLKVLSQTDIAATV